MCRLFNFSRCIVIVSEEISIIHNTDFFDQSSFLLCLSQNILSHDSVYNCICTDIRIDLRPDEHIKDLHIKSGICLFFRPYLFTHELQY